MPFSDSQLRFLAGNYVARIATSSKDEPHVSPIYFAFDRDAIFFVTERTTSKFKDIETNPKASIVVDQFDADWLHGKKGPGTTERAIAILGRATIIKDKTLHKLMCQVFMERYPDFEEEKYPTEATPILKVRADRIWEHHFP